MVEKFNHTLVTALKELAYIKPQDWDTHLNTIRYTYRVWAHESIGISYKLLYGVVPLDSNHDPILVFGEP